MKLNESLIKTGSNHLRKFNYKTVEKVTSKSTGKSNREILGLSPKQLYGPCGLYYKHTTDINYASSIVNKLNALLTDDARVVIYNHLVLTVL